jgi:hypothetical protein
VTILVMKDRGSRAIQAWGVERKGADDAALVARSVGGLRRFWHRGRFLVKTDGEPTLSVLKERIMRDLSDGAIAVEPPPHESESNGAMENGVKLINGLLRVHLMAFERKICGKIPSAYPVMAWLIEHVADVATKYLQAADGRTAYERLYGKKVHEEALEFWEKVFWRKRRTQDMNVVLDSRWVEGVWLGHRWGSIHHRLSVGNEVLEVRAVKHRPRAERWSREALEQVQVLPWPNSAPDDEAPMQVLPPLPEGERAEQPRVRPEVGPRRVYSRHADLEKRGYTSNCQRCMLMREGKSAAGKAHTEACPNPHRASHA